MEKSYPDQLGSWVKEKAATRRDRNLTAFLEARADVQAALAAGYAAKTIWRNMRETGRIPFGYDAFLHHLRQHMEYPSPAGPVRNTRSRPGAAPLQPPFTGTATTAPQTFTFNPAPSKEELL
jgi:hypothetical protein